MEIYNLVVEGKVALIRLTQGIRINNQLNTWEKSAKSNNPRESAIQTFSKSDDSADNMISKQKMNKNIKKIIACLSLVALLGMVSPLLLAQQHQNSEKTDSEPENLEDRVSQLEEQLQTVENVEKIDLQTKLAEANTKLADMEFEKFKRGLKDSNDEWLKGWSSWFLGIIAIFVAILLGVSRIFWFWLSNRADRLITDEVEKNLNRFKAAVDDQDVIKNEIGVLKKEHAASVLGDFISLYLTNVPDHPEPIKALAEEDLLQVFGDERYDIVLRYQAASVLAVRQSARLVTPLLKFLNSVVDSNFDLYFDTESRLRNCVNFFKYIPTPEASQGLTKFLDRLLTEDPKHKDIFLMETVLSLAWISIQLDIRDSVSILRKSMSHFEHPGQNNLSALVDYFDRFNEPAGIKEILSQHVTDGMSEVENKCLELLQKYDPEFVEKWRARETSDNNET